MTPHETAEFVAAFGDNERETHRRIWYQAALPNMKNMPPLWQWMGEEPPGRRDPQRIMRTLRAGLDFYREQQKPEQE